jgi:hypothetical protein
MRFEKHPIHSFTGNPTEFKSFVSELIQKQIEKKKLEFMVKWEKNHQYEDRKSEDLIASMDDHKNKILDSLKDLSHDSIIQCNISLDFWVKEKWEDN